ncbi:LysR family transcriptional regulator [Edaphobacter albus]|uniref:LysR family transcriptional regulator n=1 Tax=Edaphobacter sp. 4G125 TaxID=2763071 RepID=UPI001646F5B2|nr:LysR family transcriptional regulator [Edaphobacter sp. 4G125]QNI35678.1 LysR family transcriptional regulator [Edaphobacter sp. 4G125]
MIENFKLHVFRVVADSLNFSKAAEELHLTQPAITSQVRTLEEGLGIALFDRIGRNAKLTPAGATLLHYVRQIEILTNEAVAALAPFGIKEGSELNIGASHTIGNYLLPKILPKMLGEWPKLRIHVSTGSSSDVLNALINHEVSVGLIEAPAHRPDLKIERFFEDELCLILPLNHRWAKKSILRAAEIIQEPILLREAGSGMRRFVEEYLERNGVLRQQLHTTIDLNSTEAIISSVEAGLGIGFAPRMALEKSLRAGAVKVIALENGPISRELSIVLLGGPVNGGPLTELLNLLRSLSRISMPKPKRVGNAKEFRK